MAHTHGPLLGSDANGPSRADLDYARRLEEHSTYAVSLVVKANSDGGGRFTFFDGQGNSIPWVLTGLDEREYKQAEVRANGWGNAWERDAHGLSTSQGFLRQRAA